MHTPESLAKLYMSILAEFLKELKDKIVVFDFDGTMTHFYYDIPNHRLLPCRDDEVYEYSKTHNIYENARMLATMQYVFANLPIHNVYVLTRTETTLIEKKNDAILNNFNVLPENIYHVQEAHKKLDVLKAIHEKHNADIIFVEDTFKTILNAEEAMDFVHGIHISALIP